MAISQMTPDEIYANFLSRIEKTNMVFNLLDENSLLESENVVYFKYYFDFSTTIETIIKGIAFEESKKHPYIRYALEKEKKMFFFSYEELNAIIIDENLLYENSNESEFKTKFFDVVAKLKNQRITKRFFNDGNFKSDYELVKKTRNILAHGLAGYFTVEFTTSQLETFSYVCYLLFNYYSHLYQENNG